MRSWDGLSELALCISTFGQVGYRWPSKRFTVVYGVIACTKRGLGLACMWGNTSVRPFCPSFQDALRLEGRSAALGEPLASTLTAFIG